MSNKERVVLTVTDIKEFRKEFGYTQQNLADNFGVSKSFIGQIESGKKPLTETYRDKFSSFFTLLAEQKLRLVEQSRAEDMTKRQQYLEALYKNNNKKELIKEIATIRKANGFNPSFDEVNCDMVWMQTVLKGDERKIFESTYVHTEMRTDIEYYPMKSNRKPNIDFKYMFTIHCTDGKITVGYMVRGNDGKDIPKLVVQFNPNKVNMDYNTDFHMLSYCLGEDPIVSKIDYCIDYPNLKGSNIIVTDQQKKRGYRREESNGVTHYVGNINCNGIRVYDKRAEVQAKDGYDIGYDVVRYEHRRQICRWEEYEVFNKLDNQMETRYRSIKDVRLSNMNKHIGYTNLPMLSAVSIQQLEQAKKDITFSHLHYFTAVAILKNEFSLKECKQSSSPKDYNVVLSYVEKAKVENLTISEVDMIRCNELLWHRYNQIYTIAKKQVEDVLEMDLVVTKKVRNEDKKVIATITDNNLINELAESEYIKDFMNGTADVDVTAEQINMIF